MATRTVNLFFMHTTFTNGPHVTRTNITATRYYRVEWFEAWSPERANTGCLDAVEARRVVDALDERGATYRVFPIVLAACTATNR